MTFCSHCGTSNKSDAKYCKNCGAQLSSNAYLVCQKCNAHNPTNSHFCNRCGERLSVASVATADETKTATRQTATKTAVKGTRTSAERTAQPRLGEALKTESPATRAPDRSAPPASDRDLPDWLTRFFANTPAQKQLIPTHELLRMANALGIDVDYSTLRFWQKRGLVSKPLRGPVSSGRGTRGYYDPSLIDRLSFIREIQKRHAMGLEAIRSELEQIDKKIAESTNRPIAQLYRERLAELQAQRDAESQRTLVAVLSKAIGINPEDIAAVSIEKSDGQTIRLFGEAVPAEQNRRAS
jgi:DNA-binding transcriptional MerR regulator/ribosomal protein L40E